MARVTRRLLLETPHGERWLAGRLTRRAIGTIAGTLREGVAAAGDEPSCSRAAVSGGWRTP